MAQAAYDPELAYDLAQARLAAIGEKGTKLTQQLDRHYQTRTEAILVGTHCGLTHQTMATLLGLSEEMVAKIVRTERNQ